MRRMALIAALTLVAVAVPTAAAENVEPAAQGERLAKEGDDLYRKGAYSEALRKFEAAMAAGQVTPAILYQTGNCYKVVMSDSGRELELKKKAMPLLEAEITSGRGGIESHYYLAAIYIHNLEDPVKGVDVARKGVALVERPDPSLRRPVENLFRAARLYEFLGEDEKSAAMDEDFLEAAGISPVAVDRASIRLSREKLGAYLMRKSEFSRAAAIFEAIVKAEPVRDVDRHQWGLALLRGGKPEEAAKAWRGAVSDEWRTELAYLDKAVMRYVQAGNPASSTKFPGAEALADQDLAAKIIEAGAAVREHKQKADSEAKARNEAAVMEETRRREQVLAMSPEERKARWEKKKAEMAASGKGASSGGQESPPARGAAQIPGKSEEWMAAERDFFHLLEEYIERGQLIRMYCFQSGLSDLVFR